MENKARTQLARLSRVWSGKFIKTRSMVMEEKNLMFPTL